MDQSYFLGIDIGTFETKGALIDANAQVVASHAVHHELIQPAPGYFEHNAEHTWWHDICNVTRTILEKSGIDPSSIKAVGTSTLGPDLVAVDDRCRPLRNAILYGIDARASSEIKELTDQLGEETIIKRVGHPFNSNDIGPKILWLKHHEPEVYQNAYKFLTGSSFVTARLTGRYVIDSFLATGCFMPMYKTDGSIDEDYISCFCRPDQMAEVHASTDIVGRITDEAAAQTGLKAGTPVITGTDDAGAEAISVGIFRPGDMMLMFGSSLYIIGLGDHDITDNRVWCDPFILPDSHSVQGGTNAAGTLTKWYRDHIFPDYLEAEKAGGKNAYEAMYEAARSVPAGSDGLITLPYIAGERTPLDDPLAKGMLFGLKIDHTRNHLYRSALESVGYSIAQHLDIFHENNFDFHNIVAIGGGSKNPLWMQIVADITGKPIHTAKEKIGASYGDALMAAIAVGHFKDFESAAPYVLYDRTFLPDPDNHAIYQHQRQIFDQLYRRNADLMHQL